jgi:hypothetical protein
MIVLPFGIRQVNISSQHHERMVCSQCIESILSLMINQKLSQFRGAHGLKLHLYLTQIPPVRRQL